MRETKCDYCESMCFDGTDDEKMCEECLLSLPSTGHQCRVLIAALRAENATQPAGYISKNAEKYLEFGNNVCDVTILHESGERCCVPIFLAPPFLPTEQAREG